MLCNFTQMLTELKPKWGNSSYRKALYGDASQDGHVPHLTPGSCGGGPSEAAAMIQAARSLPLLSSWLLLVTAGIWEVNLQVGALYLSNKYNNNNKDQHAPN